MRPAAQPRGDPRAEIVVRWGRSLLACERAPTMARARGRIPADMAAAAAGGALTLAARDDDEAQEEARGERAIDVDGAKACAIAAVLFAGLLTAVAVTAPAAPRAFDAEDIAVSFGAAARHATPRAKAAARAARAATTSGAAVDRATVDDAMFARLEPRASDAAAEPDAFARLLGDLGSPAPGVDARLLAALAALPRWTAPEAPPLFARSFAGAVPLDSLAGLGGLTSGRAGGYRLARATLTAGEPELLPPRAPVIVAPPPSTPSTPVEGEAETCPSRAGIARAVRRATPALRFCFQESQARTGRALDGRVALRWHIDERGAFHDVSVESSTSPDVELGLCAARAIGRERVSPCDEDGGDVIVTYPLLFTMAR